MVTIAILLAAALVLGAVAAFTLRSGCSTGNRRAGFFLAVGLVLFAATLARSAVRVDAADTRPSGVPEALLFSAGAVCLSLGLLRITAARRTDLAARPAPAGGDQNDDGERRFRSLIDRIPQAFAIQVDGRMVFANRAFTKIFGVPLERAIGRPLLDLVRPDHRSSLSGSSSPSSHSPTWGTIRSEVEIVHPEERGRWVEVRRQIMEWEGELGEVAFIDDITERRRLEDQLRVAQKAEAVGNLGGGIAHDFNNLLTAIIGSCEILQRRCGLDAPGHEELETIHRASERAADLTRGLLALASRQVLEAVDLDLNDLVRSDLPIMRRLIPENIVIEHELGAGPGSVHGDRSQLQQVLINLCVNARDAMPDGGVITIRTENGSVDATDVASHPWVTPGRHAVLSVSDTGIGMTQETMSRVFEPFFTTKESGHGTGLGLATLYGIVKQHKGMVRVESELGQGSTFSVFLPLVERPARATRDEASRFPGGGHESILVVEDEPEVRRVLVQVLSDLGYHVMQASDGVQALEILRGRAVDLVLTDLVMPRMGGRELLERVSTLYPATAFLFSSGYSAGLVADGLPERGNVEFIAKPYGIDALARKVREVLDRGARTPEPSASAR